MARFARVSLWLFFAVTALCTPLVGYSFSPEDGLMAAYDFEGPPASVLQDRSGHANTGIVVQVDFAHDAKDSQWGQFDGSNSYVRVPHRPSLASVTFTITAWAWSDEENAIVDRGVFGKHRENDNVSYFWLYQHERQIQATMVGQVRDNFQHLSCDAAAWYKKWAFVAVSYDGQYFSLTVNGQLIGVQPVQGFIGNRYDPLIGAGELAMASRQPQRWWKGRIDDVRFYNRCLRPEELAALSATRPVTALPGTGEAPARPAPGSVAVVAATASARSTPKPPSLDEIKQALGRLSPEQLNGIFSSISPAIHLMPGVTRIAFSDGVTPWEDTTLFTPRDTLHIRVEDVALEAAVDKGASVKILATQGGDAAAGIDPYEYSVTLAPDENGGFKGTIPLGIFIPGKVYLSVIGLSPDGTQLFRVSTITLKP